MCRIYIVLFNKNNPSCYVEYMLQFTYKKCTMSRIVLCLSVFFCVQWIWFILLGSSVTCKGVCQCVCVLFNLQVNTMISTYIRVLHLWSALRFGVSLRIDAKTKHIFGYTSSNIHSYTLILTTLVMGWLYFFLFLMFWGWAQSRIQMVQLSACKIVGDAHSVSFVVALVSLD